MFEILNSESSLPLAIVVSSIVLASLFRPILCAIAALILTRKASPEMRVKALEVLCSDRRFRRSWRHKRLEEAQDSFASKEREPCSDA